MRSMYKALAAIVLLTAISCATAAENPIAISGQYGTIGYSGTVFREETPQTYVFTVQRLELKFLPDADTNSVESIVNPELCLVTTYLAPGASRAARTSRTCTTLQITLDTQQPFASLQNLHFTVEKAKVDASTYTILDLTDGRILWPFASQLKP